MSNWIDQCHFGDCRDTMRAMIADGVKVQTIVTSPPYWGLRDYGVDGQIGHEPTLREFIDTLTGVFELCRELLADDGTAWVNMGDAYANDSKWGGSTGGKHVAALHGDSGIGRAKRYTGLKAKDLMGQPWRLAFALQDAGWYLRQDIVWHKPNPMPESVQDRCTKAHEYIFLLTKSSSYYCDMASIRVPASLETKIQSFDTMNFKARDKYKTAGNVNPPKGAVAYADGDERHRTKAGLLAYAQKTRADGEVDLSTANRRSVWTIATEAYPGAHFATFPEALVEPCVLAGSRAGDVVFDPFFGSGTTGQVAARLGRQFIGCELNPAYEALQRDRIRERGFEFA
jgi:site-specific DNA-methyltransferase (cytosine-N4-specific)